MRRASSLLHRRGPYRYFGGILDLIQNAYRMDVAVLTGGLWYIIDVMVAGAPWTNERLSRPNVTHASRDQGAPSQ